MKKKLKVIVFAIALFGTSIALAFGVGTFYPNIYVLEKTKATYQKETLKQWNAFGLLPPSIEYSNNKEFVLAVGRCIDYVNLSILPEDRIHREIIISMAVLESGYGKSRFANEGNNLFGIRTWDDTIPQLKPLGNPDVKWGVRAYKTKCDSVKHMISTINNHHAYELFREERSNQLKSNSININKQIELLKKWSTNPIYTDLIKQKVLSIRKVLENA